MTGYYRTSGKTSRAKCDNCGRPFKEHKLAGIDRDGELHACPRVLKRSPSSGRLEVTNSSAVKDAEAYMEAITLLESVREGVNDYFKIGRFACKKRLANGAMLKVEIRMPALVAAKKKARRARR